MSIERGPTVHWTIAVLEIVTVFMNVALKTAASAQRCFLPDTSIVRNRANLPAFGKCRRQNFPETSKKWQIWFHKVQSSVHALTSNSILSVNSISWSLCSSLKSTDARFILKISHIFHTVGEPGKAKIPCADSGRFTHLWSKHFQFREYFIPNHKKRFDKKLKFFAISLPLFTYSAIYLSESKP